MVSFLEGKLEFRNQHSRVLMTVLVYVLLLPDWITKVNVINWTRNAGVTIWVIAMAVKMQ